MTELDRYAATPRNLSGEDLKLMGNRASRAFLEKEASLTDAITDMARDEGLNSYQIQRVCEFANNTTFKALFQKQASKIVEFPVADARQVQDRIGCGTIKTASAPSMYTEPYSLGQESVDLEERFGINLEKTASAEFDENYRLKLTHLWTGLENELDGLKTQAREKSMLAKEAAARFFDESRRVIGLEEATLSDVASVVLQRAKSQGFAKEAMRNLTQDLFDSGYLTKEAVGMEADGAVATDQVADPASPVAQSFDQFQQLVMDVQTLARAIAQITSARDQAKAALTGGMLPSAQGPGPQTAQREEMPV